MPCLCFASPILIVFPAQKSCAWEREGTEGHQELCETGQVTTAYGQA